MNVKEQDMKHLIFCFDGTWHKLVPDEVTNVGLTAKNIAGTTPKGISQIVYYSDGVGNVHRDSGIVVKTLVKWGGGLFGHGLLANLVDAYRFLIFNYEPGDEIFIFGFSRGAFSARSFAGLLHASGILSKSNAERISEAIDHYTNFKSETERDSKTERDRQFRWKYGREVCVDEAEDAWRCKTFPLEYKAGDGYILSIKYIGVWDTVGALGLPNHWWISHIFNRKYLFHDTELLSFTKRAQHAVAIDERRKSFSPTLWKNIDEMNRDFDSSDPKTPYREMWFPGTHGSVGGGGKSRSLGWGAAVDIKRRSRSRIGSRYNRHKNGLFGPVRKQRAERRNYARVKDLAIFQSRQIARTEDYP